MPFIESNIDIQGADAAARSAAAAAGRGDPRVDTTSASPSYFTVMGVRPLKGRLLDDRDGAERAASRRDQRSVRGAIPARRRSDRPAPRDSAPQGKPAQTRDRRRRARRCGTSGSIQRPRAEVLLPFAQSPTGSITLVARTSVDPATLIETDQARDLDDRSAADLLPHRDARGAGRSHAHHASLRADRADGICGAGAAAGRGRPLRRAEHDRLAVPARRSACGWRSAPRGSTSSSWS